MPAAKDAMTTLLRAPRLDPLWEKCPARTDGEAVRALVREWRRRLMHNVAARRAARKENRK